MPSRLGSHGGTFTDVACPLKTSCLHHVHQPALLAGASGACWHQGPRRAAHSVTVKSGAAVSGEAIA